MRGMGLCTEYTLKTLSVDVLKRLKIWSLHNQKNFYLVENYMNVCYSLCFSFHLPGYLKCKKYKQWPQFCRKKKGRNILV